MAVYESNGHNSPFSRCEQPNTVFQFFVIVSFFLHFLPLFFKIIFQSFSRSSHANEIIAYYCRVKKFQGFLGYSRVPNEIFHHKEKLQDLDNFLTSAHEFLRRFQMIQIACLYEIS